MENSSIIKQFHTYLLKNRVSKLTNPYATTQFTPFSFGLTPAILQTSVFSKIKQYSYLWQKLVALSSLDAQIITKTLPQQMINDNCIGQILKLFSDEEIYNHQKNKPKLTLCRYDFFIQKGKPKLIEYNLAAVSMAAVSTKFQQAYTHFYDKQNVLPINNALNTYTNCINSFYKTFDIDGIFLSVILTDQTNVNDQKILYEEISQKSEKKIKCCQILCSQFMDKTVLNQKSQLLFQGQKVGIVYFRSGYSSKCCLREQLKARVCKSTAISIPWIGGDLMNTKRMQAEISKPNIMKKYLDEKQINILIDSIIPTWDFSQCNNDQNSIQQLLNIIQKEGEQNFILKPNQQGGGFNIFGKAAVQQLKKLSPKQRQKYILVRRIYPDCFQGQYVDSETLKINQGKIDSQFSIYGGFILDQNGKLIQNNIGGFLVRSKSQQKNEGGLMSGNGFLSALKIQNKE